MIYNNDERYNSSGCKDITAYRALRSVKKQERRELIQKLKELANHHGYDIISIIRLLRKYSEIRMIYRVCQVKCVSFFAHI